LLSHVPRTLTIIIRLNRLDMKFDFVNDMVAYKESEHKVFSYEGNGFRAIERPLVRGCAY